MISTDIANSVPFTPPWLEGKPNAPVFYLRGGSVIERGLMEAELAGTHRAGPILGYELLEAIRSGVATLLATDPDLDRVLGLVEAEASGETEGFDDDDRQLLVEIRKTLAEHWPEYRDLLAQSQRRNQIAPIVALQRFCTGWENVVDDKRKPIAFERERRSGLVADVALARVPALEMLFTGNRAYSMQYCADQEGNLPRPSSSDDGLQTSRSDDTSTVGGKSETAPGKKTRASRSRRGSGRS
jgi:hypothetical protein